MSQTSNILTLRTKRQNFNFLGNVSFLQLVLFFRTSKVKNYKKLFKSIKKTENVTKFHQILSFQSLVFTQLNRLKKNCIFLSIVNSNLKITNPLIKSLYNRLKRFNSTLFLRRFNLFFDFVKLTSLFIESKLNAVSFLSLLGQVFRQLIKKRHAAFLFFCKILFNEILLSKFKTQKKSKALLGKFKSKNRTLVGIQFLLNGKLMGKRRASSTKLLFGSVPIHTIDADIEYSKNHIYTLYGTFGFHL